LIVRDVSEVSEGQKMTQSFYEFGMARAGFGLEWTCTFANDIEAKKARSYAPNWGRPGLVVDDVANLKPSDPPGVASLAWASFPCQDISLAGMGAGLYGARSSSFWRFWRSMQALRAEGRAPLMIVLENVCGLLTSHGGHDFAAIADALTDGATASALSRWTRRILCRNRESACSSSGSTRRCLS
jgi:DNA (cytosine-5)-methyltransferase 1